MEEAKQCVEHIFGVEIPEPQSETGGTTASVLPFTLGQRLNLADAITQNRVSMEDLVISGLQIIKTEIESEKTQTLTLEDIPTQSPRLDLSFSMEGFEAQQFRAAQGTASWFWYEASGEHPLDFWRETWECIDFGEFVASFKSADGEIALQFSGDFTPNTIYVRRWSAEYIGLTSEMWNIYEPVEIIGNIIYISDNGNDYIYEIEARWARGDIAIPFYSSTLFYLNKTE